MNVDVADAAAGSTIEKPVRELGGGGWNRAECLVKIICAITAQLTENTRSRVIESLLVFVWVQ